MRRFRSHFDVRCLQNVSCLRVVYTLVIVLQECSMRVPFVFPEVVRGRGWGGGGGGGKDVIPMEC